MTNNNSELVTLISNLRTKRNRLEKKLKNQEKKVDEIDTHIGSLMFGGRKKNSASVQILELRMNSELVALGHYYDLLEKLVNHISQVKQKLTAEFDA